jgi:hypothetical protein
LGSLVLNFIPCPAGGEVYFGTEIVTGRIPLFEWWPFDSH